MSAFSLHKSDLLFRAAPCLSVLVATLLSILLLKKLSSPYPSIAILWAAICLTNTVLAKAPWAKLLWLNAASVCILFGLAESYFLLRGRAAAPVLEEGTMGTSLMRADEVLGYAPKAGAVVTDRRQVGGELMWDVVYTIDDRGLRVTPQPANPKAPIKCVLFFGDSFTFGTGVPDEKTMPYQVGVKSKPMYRAFNFGVLGYGPHQMLSALEHDLTTKLVDCDTNLVTHVIYQAIWQHASRVAGLALWDSHGPRYELADNGVLSYRGHFDDGLRKIWRTVAIQALKSQAFQRFMGIPEKHFRRHNSDDIALYIAIVARARDLARSRFPCAMFHVLFWDSEAKQSEAILDDLGALGLNLYLISAILPEYDGSADDSVYMTHPRDRHPSALAHELIADFVVQKILPEKSRCDRSIIGRGAAVARRPPPAP
jgi:hypothetical protein